MKYVAYGCSGCFVLFLLAMIFAVAVSRSRTLTETPSKTAATITFATAQHAIAPDEEVPSGSHQKSVTDYLGHPDASYFNDAGIFVLEYTFSDCRAAIFFKRDDTVAGMRRLN